MKFLLTLLEASKLSDDAKEMLGYLVHSKSHVFNSTDKDKDMEEVFKKCTEQTKMKLFRGLSKEALAKIISTGTMVQYTSFSESKELAADFGTEVITLQPKAKGFCYWRYMVDDMEQLKKNDPEEFGMVDGDFMIETFEKELEWIMPFNMPVKLIDKDNLIFEAI